MDNLLVLIGLAAIAFLVGSILGFVSFGRTNELRRDLVLLRRQVSDLESRVLNTAMPAPSEVAGSAEQRDERGIPVADEPVSPEPVEIVSNAASAAESTVEVGPDMATTGPDTASAGPYTPPKAARGDLEAALGMRWTAWIGGLALALGGIFLVRYSIEAGLLGPAARIGAGLIFSLALLGLGEWMRRKEIAEPASPGMRAAYIPGILTAAGIVAIFATTYAAYFLYEFLGPTAAFVILANIALGALALSYLHGPAIAGLGLAASYATPFLVSTTKPSFPALSVYLTIVMIATLTLARLKEWRWLGILATIGAVCWSLLMSRVSGWNDLVDGPTIAIYTGVAFALAAYVFVVTIHPRDPGRVYRDHDLATVVVLSAFVLASLYHLAVFGTALSSVALMLTIAATLVTLAYAWPVVRMLALPATALVLLGFTAFDVPNLGLVFDPVAMTEVTPGLSDLMLVPDASRLIAAALLTGLLFAGLGLFGVLGSAARIELAIVGTLIPLGLLVITYLRVTHFEVSQVFGVAALAVAAYFAATTEALIRRLDPEEHGVDGAIAAYAVAGFAALAAAISMVFEKSVLTVALAAIMPAIAFVEVARPVRGMRFIALAVAAIVAIRLFAGPELMGLNFGEIPGYGTLFFVYGSVSLAFIASAWRLGLTRQDPFVPLFEALAVISTTLSVVVLIHRWMSPDNFYGPVETLSEQSLLSMSLLAISMGMQWLGIRRPGMVFSTGTLVVGALGLISAGIGLGFVYNPVFTGEPILDGAFDGALAIGYLVPAIMAFVVAVLASYREDRPTWYVRIASALGSLLAFLWVTLAVRAAWHAGDLSMGDIEQGELYAYSVVWLVSSMAVLAVGVMVGSRPMRMIALLLVGLVVLKVFVLDTAGLDAGLRAVSFIGLGAVLMGVAFAYQKFLKRLV